MWMQYILVCACLGAEASDSYALKRMRNASLVIFSKEGILAIVNTSKTEN